MTHTAKAHPRTPPHAAHTAYTGAPMRPTPAATPLAGQPPAHSAAPLGRPPAPSAARSAHPPHPALPQAPPLSASHPLADRFRRMVQEVTGIYLPPAKDAMVETRLRSRIHATGHDSARDYFGHLFEQGGLEAELPHIVELVTTNKTDFWREPAHFELLRDVLLPAALRRAAPHRKIPFKLWSAAASTGAEAWSAAMVLAAAQERHPQIEWAILGTDISRRVLATARRAIYPEEELGTVPADLRERFAMRGRSPGGEAARRISPALRARVRFEELNLMSIPYPIDRDLDVIFLRNVLIYFDPPTQGRVISALAGHLRPGGHLIVGHAESMTVRQKGLRQVAPAVFERTDEQEGPA